MQRCNGLRHRWVKVCQVPSPWKRRSVLWLCLLTYNITSEKHGAYDMCLASEAFQMPQHLLWCGLGLSCLMWKLNVSLKHRPETPMMETGHKMDSEEQTDKVKVFIKERYSQQRECALKNRRGRKRLRFWQHSRTSDFLERRDMLEGMNWAES